MEPFTIVALVAVTITLLLLFGSTRWNLTLQTHEWQLRALAQASCPKCGHTVGRDEAVIANIASDDLIRKYSSAQVEVTHESHWPLTCPQCSERLVYWLANRKLFTEQKLLSEGWIKDE